MGHVGIDKTDWIVQLVSDTGPPVDQGSPILAECTSLVCVSRISLLAFSSSRILVFQGLLRLKRAARETVEALGKQAKLRFIHGWNLHQALIKIRALDRT